MNFKILKAMVVIIGVCLCFTFALSGAASAAESEVEGDLMVTGDVGIGTSSPAENLEVLGSEHTSIQVKTSNGNSNINLDKSAASFNSYVAYKTAGVAKWIMGTSDSDITGDGSEFYIGETLGGNSPAFWIESGGNVGIGTTTPGALFDVKGGNIQVSDGTGTHLVLGGYKSAVIDTDSNILSTTAGGSYPFNGAGNLVLKPRTHDSLDLVVLTGASDLVRFAVEGSGQVVVSDTNGGIFQIDSLDTDIQSGDVLGTLSFTARHDGSSDGDINKGRIRTEATGVYGGTPTDLSKMVFSLTNGSGVLTDYMTLLSGGKVGIGTASPDCRLSVEDDEDFGFVAEFVNTADDAGAAGIRVEAGPSNPTGATNILNAHILNASAATGGLQIYNGTFGIWTSSDASLKRDIRPTQIDTERIMDDIEISDYRWIDGDMEQTGFIAQNLEVAYPPAAGIKSYTVELDTGSTQTVVVQEADELTTGSVAITKEVWVPDTEVRTKKVVMPLRLIPVLVKECQRLKEEVVALRAERDVTITSEIAASALEGWTPSEAALELIIDALLAEIEEAPWVEISARDALELVAEMESVDTPTSVTKYRLNAATGFLDPYETTEIVTTTQPTGRQIYQLKEGVRLDENTGQYFIRQAAASDSAVALLAPEERQILLALQGTLKQRILLAKKTPALDKSLLDTIASAENQLNILNEKMETASVEAKGE